MTRNWHRYRSILLFGLLPLAGAVLWGAVSALLLSPLIPQSATAFHTIFLLTATTAFLLGVLRLFGVISEAHLPIQTIGIVMSAAIVAIGWYAASDMNAHVDAAKQNRQIRLEVSGRIMSLFDDAIESLAQPEAIVRRIESLSANEGISMVEIAKNHEFYETVIDGETLNYDEWRDRVMSKQQPVSDNVMLNERKIALMRLYFELEDSIGGVDIDAFRTRLNRIVTVDAIWYPNPFVSAEILEGFESYYSALHGLLAILPVGEDDRLVRVLDTIGSGELSGDLDASIQKLRSNQVEIQRVLVGDLTQAYR